MTGAACAAGPAGAGAGGRGGGSRLRREVLTNPCNAAIFARWGALGLPDAWLVAGCLFQTVWNLRAGHAPAAQIKDYDLFYFDAADLSAAAEAAVQQRIDALFADLGVAIEVANQARVHLWYPDWFGHPYPALPSAAAGIERFLVAETCIGMRPDALCAPFGTAGLYAGTLTPNPSMPQPALFARKVSSYRARWPWLRVAAAPTPTG